MGAREVETSGLGNTTLKAWQILRATRHVADRIGAENPHELDESMPRLAGRLAAREPDVADELLNLLAVLDLPTDSARLRWVKAQAAAELAQPRKEQQ